MGGLLNLSSAVITGTTGDLAIIPAITGKITQIHGYVIASAAASTVRWESGAGGAALTGAMQISMGSIIVPYSDVPWFKTASSATIMSLEVTGDVKGHCIYSAVTA